VELLALFEKSPEREEESQALFFDYIDNGGIEHRVWYADSKTINYWIDILQQAGNHDISLWRLGGNLNLKSIK
jgi:spore germination protein